MGSWINSIKLNVFGFSHSPTTPTAPVPPVPSFPNSINSPLIYPDPGDITETLERTPVPTDPTKHSNPEPDPRVIGL